MIEAEFECRLLIPKDRYDVLFKFFESHFGPIKEIVQTNYYFDTKDLDISKNGDVLRIRVVKGKSRSVITYKQKGVESDMEYTQILTSNCDIESLVKNGVFPIGDAIKALQEKGIDTSRLYYCGEITTTRYEYNDNDCLIVLDKNEYCNNVDFNLEVESKTRENAVRKVKEICNEFKIDFNNDNTPKSKRAIAAYLEKKNQEF